MALVSDLLVTKGQMYWSVTPETSIHEALKILAEKDVGALLVLEGKKLAGIISERDYVRKILLLGEISMDTPVQELMSTKVFYVTPSQSIDECMAFMASKDIRYLPVMENDELVGLVSIGDVVREVVSGKDVEIVQLEAYITGLLLSG